MFNAQEITSIALTIKNIVEFESPRVLIQEVASQSVVSTDTQH
jgi:hypothetical protein